MMSESGAARVLRALHANEERLVCVTGYFWADNVGMREMLLRELMLEFESTSLCIQVTDDDSLLVGTCRRDPTLVPATLSHHQQWKGALQKPLLWSWAMTNQQGYEDGIQLEFADSGADVPVVVQLVAIGAEIRLRSVDAEWTRWDGVVLQRP